MVRPRSGGYEGLAAVAEVPIVNDIWSLNGLIFPGDLPSPTAVDASPAPSPSSPVEVLLSGGALEAGTNMPNP